MRASLGTLTVPSLINLLSLFAGINRYRSLIGGSVCFFLKLNMVLALTKRFNILDFMFI